MLYLAQDGDDDDVGWRIRLQNDERSVKGCPLRIVYVDGQPGKPYYT